MFHFEHGRQGRGMRGGRARGEMKYEILECLAQGPRHGYDIMLEIEGKTGMIADLCSGVNDLVQALCDVAHLPDDAPRGPFAAAPGPPRRIAVTVDELFT